MDSKLTSLLLFILMAALFAACAIKRPDTGVTGLTTRCGNELRPLLDCKGGYEQYARTLRFDIGVFKEAAVGFGVGAKRLMQLDSLAADLLNHQRQVCIDYNNCIVTKEEYRKEMAFLRRVQLKVREATAQLTSGTPPGIENSDTEEGNPPKSKIAFEELFAEIIRTLAGYENQELIEDDFSEDTDTTL